MFVIKENKTNTSIINKLLLEDGLYLIYLLINIMVWNRRMVIIMVHRKDAMGLLLILEKILTLEAIVGIK